MSSFEEKIRLLSLEKRYLKNEMERLNGELRVLNGRIESQKAEILGYETIIDIEHDKKHYCFYCGSFNLEVDEWGTSSEDNGEYPIFNIKCLDCNKKFFIKILVKNDA